MKYVIRNRLKKTAMSGCLAVLLVAVAGCVATGYGDDGYYDGGGEVGYGGVDVYEGPGYDYGGWGGWGRGYRVGPPRGGFDRGHPDRGGPPGGHGGSPQRAYHPAPQSRPMPSIPSGPRGGGGGHPGGGGRH